MYPRIRYFKIRSAVSGKDWSYLFTIISTMNYITNNKGGRKLCHGGFMYTVKAVTNSATRWECSMRYSRNCRGLLKVDLHNPDNIISSTPHNHDGSEVEIRVASSKQKIKGELQQAASAGGSTHRVLLDNLTQLSPIERTSFGNPTSVKCSFNRYIASGKPRDPNTVDELEILSVWSQDTDGNDFVIHNNHNHDNRIIVFGNNQCLEHLSNSSAWFMDGTFKVCPLLFEQFICNSCRIG